MGRPTSKRPFSILPDLQAHILCQRSRSLRLEVAQWLKLFAVSILLQAGQTEHAVQMLGNLLKLRLNNLHQVSIRVEIV